MSGNSSKMAANMIFPSTGTQVMSCMLHLLGVSLLAHFLSRRANFTTVLNFSQVPWARLCVILLFVDSWIFLFTSGILIFGVGLEYESGICSTAILLCIACYGSSKFFIYSFLIERVHVVWTPTAGIRRSKSTVYIFCMISLASYGIVAALMFVGRINYFRGDGACVVGLKDISSIPLLTFDLFINVFLNTLFLWPLFRSNISNAKIKKLATRTLLASSVALTTSTVNIVVLTILKGKELGWVCLASCGLDVILNSFAIFWVTGGATTVIKPVTTFTSATNAFPPERQRPLAFTTEKTTQMVINVEPESRCDESTNSRPAGDSNEYDYLPHGQDGKVSFIPSDTEVHVENSAQDNETNSKSLYKSMVSLFRRERSSSDPSVQIEVTGEFEMHGKPTSSINDTIAAKVSDDVYGEAL